MTSVLAFPLIVSNGEASDMCLGPDNNIWVIGSDASNNWYLWKVTPTGTVTQYAIAGYGSSGSVASICADATYIYTCGETYSNGISQYTTSGVLNASFTGAGTGTNHSMIFDGTYLWIANTTDFMRSTVTGTGTIYFLSNSVNMTSLCYDAGSATLFGGQVSGANSLIVATTAAPATYNGYISSNPADVPQECSDGTNIWQTNHTQSLAKFLISAPGTNSVYNWAGPGLSAGGFDGVVFDGTHLWVTATTGVGAGSFIQISPATPTTGTLITGSPGPGPSIPLCIGPASQNPANAPWAAGVVAGTLYAFTISGNPSMKIIGVI